MGPTKALTVYYDLPNSEVPQTIWKNSMHGWYHPAHLAQSGPVSRGFPSRMKPMNPIPSPVWVDDPVRGNYAVFDPIIRNTSAHYVTSTSANLFWDVYDNGTDTKSRLLRRF